MIACGWPIRSRREDETWHRWRQGHRRPAHGPRIRQRDQGWGRPGTELNFKLYRQATNKIVGVSDATAAFLGAFF
jgi:hypothetical protein